MGHIAKENEEERLQQFLIGLNEVYDMVRSKLLCKDLLPSLSIADSFLAYKEIVI